MFWIPLLALTCWMVVLPTVAKADTAAAPVFDPGGGTYTSAQTVSISSTTSGASIRYTTDGTTPSDTVGTLYTAPVTIGTTTTLKSIAYATGYDNSPVTTATYTIPPSISSLSPASAPVGAEVAVSGSNFGDTQGTSTVTFNGANAGTASYWTATGIMVTVPSGATTGNVVVTVNGVASSGVSFTVTSPPAITSLSPASGPVDTAVTITGTSFGASQGSSNVTFNGVSVNTISSWTATSITAAVPYGATSGNVVVWVAGVASNGASFTVTTPPAISSLSPASGPVAASVVIAGSHFGTTQGSSTVTFNGVGATASSWSDTRITAAVPSGATTGNVVVTVNSAASNGTSFAVTPAPAISSLSPTSAPAGAAVTISGTNFGETQSSSTVTFNGVGATTVSNWTATSITAVVPYAATSGNVVVTIGGVASNGVTFTVTTPPIITGLWPRLGPVGTSVAIMGKHFGATQGTSTVTFNGITATVSSWSDARITTAVPSGATTGNVVVTVNSTASDGKPFTVGAAPAITSVSPTSGEAGTQVTITGTSFGSVQGAGRVWLGSTYAAVVSWSDTQVVATVAGNSRSGAARIQIADVWSNDVSFTVSTATITSVTPSSGLPGTQVTIVGTAFGATQGDSQVLLGTANAVVQTWSNTQIVAQVAEGAASGKARVLRNGVWSNAITFTVPSLHIASIDPTSGPFGTSVTITGTGFGSTQGTGSVQLGSIAGTVVSWSDTQVVATVASGAVSGVARIQQNGAWSNAMTFTVPTGGTAITMAPNIVTLAVGDKRTIQALDNTGQPVTGLTWTSSDTNVVTLSTADPPELTAVAAGHATITAGTASADITVLAGALPLGTVIWSNPAGGSDVFYLVPAVPSPTGVADMFAFQYSGTVHAITSDGTTAWTADVANTVAVPDFQGGLVGLDQSTYNGAIVKFDGITGQRTTLYTASGDTYVGNLLIHTDGTIFAVKDTYGDTAAHDVIGIDPTGTLKFSVRIAESEYDTDVVGSGAIIAGDGNAYVPYQTVHRLGGASAPCDYHIGLKRISSSGAYVDIPVHDWTGGCPDISLLGVNMITNADNGVLMTWAWSDPVWPERPTEFHMAVVNGTSATMVNAPQVADQSMATFLSVQTQDGSFVGLIEGYPSQMIAFDQNGNVRWAIPGYYPQMATADGGVVALDDNYSLVTFDSNGNATGEVTSYTTQSWLGTTYRLGSIERIESVTTALATPPYWNVTAYNLTTSPTSPMCYDKRDQLIAEYGTYTVLDAYFDKSKLPGSQWPRFTPNCFMLTNSAHSASFTFAQINKPGRAAPEFGWALIKNPLITPASRGYGLDRWLQLYNGPRVISSGYRSPVQNFSGPYPGAPSSRHMLGDAIDFHNVTRTVSELNRMNKAALDAGASYVETGTAYCAGSLKCGHADWRHVDRNKYAVGQPEYLAANRLRGRKQRLCLNCFKMATNPEPSASDALFRWNPLRTPETARTEKEESSLQAVLPNGLTTACPGRASCPRYSGLTASRSQSSQSVTEH